jgi:hypothetical protein
MAGPVETKVQASTAVAAVSGLALWALGRYVFGGSVPDVVASWIYVIVPGVLTFAAGYLAKHTNRPDGTVITVNATGTPGAEIDKQVAAAMRRGGYMAGGTAVSDLSPPPPSVTAPEEKTLIQPPAAPE